MTINEEATMDDDLTSLGPVQLLCTIQGLLLNHSSDAVRALLRTQRVRIASDAVIPRNDATFTCQDSLESPFFVVKNLRPLPQVQTTAHASTSTRRLSGSISKTARAVLKDFYGYNVTFAEWTEFEALMNGQCITSPGLQQTPYRNWGEMLQELISETANASVGGGTGEVQELSIMHGALRTIFAAFDFDMKVKNETDDDVTCSILSTGEDFLFTEGKESACLPRLLSTDGHHLCSFGFATKVARIIWKLRPASPSTLVLDWHSVAQENNKLREGLQTYLKVGGEEPGENAYTSVQPSDRTNAILRNHQELIADAVNAVHTQFNAGMIEPHDPVNLWAAVMQACHYSIKQGRAMTIVQSARMWWFVQLGGDTSCIVRISTARKVGSRHFLTTVMKFLKYAHDSPAMVRGLRRRWEIALAKAGRTSTRATAKRAAAPTNEEPNDGDGPKGDKRRRRSSTGKTSSLSPGERTCCESTVVPSVSFDNEETASCFGYDAFGMAIPWFDQIGDTLEVLGRGRTGEVTKAVWNSRHIALKTFILEFDDSRSLQSVYQHELDVLWSLRELWGAHVPALLFHKPWPTSPLIGLELGEPLADDMSEWPDVDLQKANETMEKIRELGWHQKDVRGANFVRLKALDQEDRIAMIDFESMDKVSPAHNSS